MNAINAINLYGLTIEEKEEKDRLSATGFPNWLKQEFLSFLQGVERFGRNNYAAIAAVKSFYNKIFILF